MSITQINTYFKVKFQNNFVFISAKLITLYVNSKKMAQILKKHYILVYIQKISLNILKFKYTKILRRFYDKRKTKRDCF